jgi:fructokinase
MKYKMGIDLGGSKTEVIVLDPDQRPVYRERVATPAGSYAEILTLLADLVNGIQTGRTKMIGVILDTNLSLQPVLQVI